MAPMNGWAYTPIELEAIWAIEVEPLTVIKAYEPFYEFHLRSSALEKNPWKNKDHDAAELLMKAALAETVNRMSPPPVWPCLIHNDDGTPRTEEDGA